MGLYHIAKAVGFLNNDCQLVCADGVPCRLCFDCSHALNAV